MQILKNALRTEEVEGYTFPRRFTEKQLDYYRSAMSEKIMLRCLGTAGVNFEFVTDGGISFDYFAKSNGENDILFDVYENGIYTTTKAFAPTETHGTFTYEPLNKGEVVVKIYFPNVCELGFRNFSANVIRAVENTGKRFLFIGSSITQGSHLPRPSMSYASIIARFFGSDFINQGVGGRVFEATTFDSDLPCDADAIVIGYGGNDYRSGDSVEVVGEKARAHLSLIRKRYPDADIFQAAPLWRRDVTENDENLSRFGAVVEAYTAVCRDLNITMLDGLNLMPRLPEYYTDLNVHPNEAGYHILALNIIKGMLNTSTPTHR